MERPPARIIMKQHYRLVRKPYALRRMAAAIDRAIHGRTSKERARAAKWAAAWGTLCGIVTSGVTLRDNDIAPVRSRLRRRATDHIDIPASVSAEIGSIQPAAPAVSGDSLDRHMAAMHDEAQFSAARSDGHQDGMADQETVSADRPGSGAG